MELSQFRQKGEAPADPLQERVPFGLLPGMESLTKVSRHIAQEAQVQIPEAALLDV